MTTSDNHMAQPYPGAISNTGRWDDYVRDSKVHRRLYVDPEVFREENLKIFGANWVYVGHESEIPEPGDYKTTTMGTRPVILTHVPDGSFAVLFNRCSHRGTRLCRAPYGSAKNFLCPYHGWTFDLKGELKGVPMVSGYGSSFKLSDYNLGKAAVVDSYRGLIFASLSSDVPPLETYLGNARPYLDRFIDRSRDGRLKLRNGQHRMLVKANWKTVWDNSTDGYHPETSHRSVLMMSERRYGQGKSLSHFNGEPDDTDMYQVSLGNGHTFLDQFPGMGSLWKRARPTPGGDAYEAQLIEEYGAEEARRLLEEAPGPGMNLNIFPNLMTIGNQLVVIEPLSPHSFAMIWHATTLDGVPQEINAIRVRIAEDFPNLGESDDIENWEQIQVGLSIPEAEWVDMSRGLETDSPEPDAGLIWGKVTSDTGMRGYYREWKRLMNRPLPGVGEAA